MAAEIVPIRLGLTRGDVYTLWAPRWRDAGDEWEALLGDDDDLFVFDSEAELVAYTRSGHANDLDDHPAWKGVTTGSAHALRPAAERQFDLVGVEELLADTPTADSVAAVYRALTITASIGSVCDVTTITKFFNGNPVLGTLSNGLEAFTGRVGAKRWAEIGAAVERAWDEVLDACDGLVSTPDVDADAVAAAQRDLDADPPEQEEAPAAAEPATGDLPALPGEVATIAIEPGEVESDPVDEALAVEARRQVLGGADDFWLQVGIDPIRMMTASGTFHSLRCYLDDQPVFLGRNGRISVFTSERALARYLADEHDHDLSGLATYDDIRTAANDGSLRVEATEENVYVLNGIDEDIAEDPDVVDADQLALAVEWLRDVGDYAEDKVVTETLDAGQPLGAVVAYVLDRTTKPDGPYVRAAEQWAELEQFAESRLRRE